jgi:tetratricopeptide (TPR) repeat protein
MCNFHPLWEQPSKDQYQKGVKIIAAARNISTDENSREAQYIGAVANVYDDFDKYDYHTRVLKFEKASEQLCSKFPDDNEAVIFYALALRASADPKDKTFANQKKAGAILEKLFAKYPDHPGIAHYLIHTYDYPELASMALPAARKYANIASGSAHAQHMPSHIFTRLGLWDEAIQSNTQSVSAARCYAEKSAMKGHWDEELHGLDYLMYAYLQKGDEVNAHQLMEYFMSIKSVFPQNFKGAYTFASLPSRFAIERHDWKAGAALKLTPDSFPWSDYPWEKSNVNLARLLSAVHLKNLTQAQEELRSLRENYNVLKAKGENYKASIVEIQVKTGDAWIKFLEGKKNDAIAMMTNAADQEDATDKHPVTPGEIIPARELLADLYIELKQYDLALKSYDADLRRHPNRFNALAGAAKAAEKLGDVEKAKQYYKDLSAIAEKNSTRPEMRTAALYP